MCLQITLVTERLSAHITVIRMLTITYVLMSLQNILMIEWCLT